MLMSYEIANSIAISVIRMIWWVIYLSSGQVGVWKHWQLASRGEKAALQDHLWGVGRRTSDHHFLMQELPVEVVLQPFYRKKRNLPADTKSPVRCTDGGFTLKILII